MGQAPHDRPPRVDLSSLFVALVDGHSASETLQVDGFALSIGSVSVGLPTSCTADAVLLRYLELVRLVGPRRGAFPEVTPRDDIEALASATRLDGTTVRRRLERLRR